MQFLQSGEMQNRRTFVNSSRKKKKTVSTGGIFHSERICWNIDEAGEG